MLVAVTTTGTSLLTNAVNYVFKNPERGQKLEQIAGIIEGIRDSTRRMDRAALEFAEKEGKELENDERALEKFEKELESELTAYLNEAGEKVASAELNTLRTMEEKSREKGRKDIQLQEGKIHVVLLHSDTITGRVCANALSKHFEKNKISNQLVKTPGLEFKPERFMIYGLNSLVNNLIKIVKEFKKRGEVIFCATGGYKAELALANLVGLLFRVKVYYLHELFNDTVIIPPLPLVVDPEFWERNKEFLKWISKNPSTKEEIEEEFGKLSTELILLLEEQDKRLYISPVGQLMIEYFKESQTTGPEIGMDFKIRTSGGHRAAPSISQKQRVTSLSDIDNEDAKKILERVKILGVNEVILGEFHPTKTSETFLKVESVKDNTLDCTLNCKKFTQKLILITSSSEKAKNVRFMLGEKATP